jgi:hypothetical protein
MKDLFAAVLIWMAAVMTSDMVVRLVGLFVQTDGLPSTLFGTGMSLAGAVAGAQYWHARHA